MPTCQSLRKLCRRWIRWRGGGCWVGVASTGTIDIDIKSRAEVHEEDPYVPHRERGRLIGVQWREGSQLFDICV